jgi:hypothetical protein
MIQSNIFTKHAATHIALDVPTAERLEKLGMPNVVRAADMLLVGPSSGDAAEHARLRAAWWNSTEGWDQLYAAGVRWEPPVAVWVSANPAERINLWRTCSRLRDLGLSHRDALIIDLAPHVRQRADVACRDYVASRLDEVLLAALTEASPWTRAHYDRAVNLWRRYVDPEFSRFARTCARGFNGFPDLASVWELLSSFFPRVTASGKLHPSRLDGLILHILSDEWMTPVKVFVHKSDEGENLRNILVCTGDLFLERRLSDWASHGPEPTVERAPGPRPDVEMNAYVYRLSARGKRLREHGLAQLTDAPRLPLGGTEAYAPASPWALRDDGTLIREVTR